MDSRWANLFFAPAVPKLVDGTPAAYAVLMRLLVSKTDWYAPETRCLHTCGRSTHESGDFPHQVQSVVDVAFLMRLDRFIQDRASRVLLKILAARPDKAAPVVVPNANGALRLV